MNRRAQILQITDHLIRKNGYAGFSYKDLAKEIGISTASLHYHFEKKEDLALALCDKLEESLAPAEIKSDVNYSPLRFLNNYLTKRIKMVEQDEICPISAMQSGLNTLPIKVQQRLRSLSSIELKVLVGLVKDAQSSGELKITQPVDVYACTLLATLKGALQYGRVLGPAYRDKVINKLLEELATN